MLTADTMNERKAAEAVLPSSRVGSADRLVGMLVPLTDLPSTPVDGLDALRAEISVGEIMGWIERTARWVDPATFKLLPVWFPEHARGAPFYKGGWSEPQMNTTKSTNTTVHKREGNRYANMALTLALGLTKVTRPNWSCCHIWGSDDPTFQTGNAIVQDRRFYSCVANMVLLPTPLKAFTDVMPEVKAMLRICAGNLYGWSCDHPSVSDTLIALECWDAWEAYPKSWPRAERASIPIGVLPLNDKIAKAAQARVERIRKDLIGAGPHFPIEAVRAALHYWGIAEKTPLSQQLQ